MQHEEQNVILDDMMGSLKRLGVMGEQIYEELDEQQECVYFVFYFILRDNCLLKIC